jgi:hypothetical protein
MSLAHPKESESVTNSREDLRPPLLVATLG